MKIFCTPDHAFLLIFHIWFYDKDFFSSLCVLSSSSSTKQLKVFSTILYFLFYSNILSFLKIQSPSMHRHPSPPPSGIPHPRTPHPQTPHRVGGVEHRVINAHPLTVLIITPLLLSHAQCFHIYVHMCSVYASYSV
jgi:hypothetical protein